MDARDKTGEAVQAFESAPVGSTLWSMEGPRQIAVASILGAEREVLLIHNGEAYRLRITANNKLILTK
jgi:hemin uptake protein HemP